MNEESFRNIDSINENVWSRIFNISLNLRMKKNRMEENGGKK